MYGCLDSATILELDTLCSLADCLFDEHIGLIAKQDQPTVALCGLKPHCHSHEFTS